VDILCIGEMVIDFLPGSEPGSYIRNAGGAPANVAIAAARNGLASGFLGKMGNDDFGRFLQATLRDNGVAVVLEKLSDEAVTTMAFVTLGADGERSFTFARKPGADMLLRPDEVPPDLVAASTIVHAGSCSLSRSPAAEATIEAMRLGRQNGRLVSFDINYRNLLWDDDAAACARRVEEVLPFVDLLKVSEEEIELIGGSDRLPARLGDLGIALAVETFGSKGSRCHFRGETIDIAPVPAVAVDTTGAGDAFWGAFLAHLVLAGVRRTADLTADLVAAAGRAGAAAGSLCVRRKGAIAALPTRAEILALVGANQKNS
jgi:sugar/nucleoside kinase (ribokinase family)